MSKNQAFGRDLLASVVVFLVALPLCMGISIASGLPPTAGIITGIIGGIIVGLVAGSPLQVSGPAAGLTVLVWQLNEQHGLVVLGLIVLLAGLMQLAAGYAKLGQWFRAVSPAVIYGMLAGIGVLIFASQFHVMLDAKPLGSGIQNLLGIPAALGQALFNEGSQRQAALVGFLAVGVMAVWATPLVPKAAKKVPGPLVAVLVATAVANILELPIKYIEVPDNIWSVTFFPTIDLLPKLLDRAVWLGAASIAFIASAETLLCATAVDAMHQGPRTRYDKELVAQGIGNTLCGALGVLPMTGVIVRSSANVEAGATSRNSAVLHGVWLLLFASLLPFTLRYIPTASLAAILVFTGYKLAYPKIIPTLLKYGKTKVAIYAITVIMIVLTNLLEGVLVGMLLSLIKLLDAVSVLEVRRSDDEGGRITLRLEGAATLLRLPQLARALEKLPAATEVVIDGQGLSYIDHACLDLLTTWARQQAATGGTAIVDWDDLHRRYQSRRHRPAVRAS